MSRGADLKLLIFFGSSSRNSSNSSNSRNNNSERNFDDLDNKSADLRSFLCFSSVAYRNVPCMCILYIVPCMRIWHVYHVVCDITGEFVCIVYVYWMFMAGICILYMRIACVHGSIYILHGDIACVYCMCILHCSLHIVVHVIIAYLLAYAYCICILQEYIACVYCIFHVNNAYLYCVGLMHVYIAYVCILHVYIACVYCMCILHCSLDIILHVYIAYLFCIWLYIVYAYCRCVLHISCVYCISILYMFNACVYFICMHIACVYW